MIMVLLAYPPRAYQGPVATVGTYFKYSTGLETLVGNDFVQIHDTMRTETQREREKAHVCVCVCLSSNIFHS
jgi:hypothetical protein